MILKNNKLGSIRIKAMVYEFEEYEIYSTFSNASALVVTNSLYNKWLGDNLFFAKNPFESILIDSVEYYYFVSNKNFKIIPASTGNIICNPQEILEFVSALKQMRTRTDISLYDGIFIQEFGYILPTYTNIKKTDDALIGSYISGGQSQNYSDCNYKALFLDESVYEEISRITGIERIKPINEAKVQVDYSQTFTLPGRPELEKFFNEHIINILNEPERYKKLGIDFPSSIVLYGPPGCGKTFAVDRLAEYLGIPRFDINSSTIASPYVHDTAKKISAVFQSAIDSAPSIIVIDEMESYLSDRGSNSAGQNHYEEVAEFLRQIQEAQKNHVLIIAMTNMYDKIDPAILRRGRFDHHLEVGLPSVDEIRSLLSNITKNIALSSNISLDELAKNLEGKSLADVAYVIKEAGLISGRNGDEEITINAINGALSNLTTGNKKNRMGFGND